MKNKKSKWCYAAGCIGRDMTYTLVSLFLLTYIQYTALVNTAQFLVLSVIIVLCRIWDAINDPMMGTIISNTRSRFGKYRPWVLIGAICNAIILILMFTIRITNKQGIDSYGWINVAILGILYLLWGMTFTMNDVSYWSLLPVLAEDKQDRDRLTTMVAVFASLGAFIAGGLVPLLTPGNMIVAYRNFAIIFALIFLICQLVVFFFVYDNKENPFKISQETMENLKKDKSVTLKDMFSILLRNKQLLVMAIVVLLYSLGSAILNAFGQNFFYFKFGYNGNQMFLFTIIYAIGTLISQAFYPLLANRFKRSQIVRSSIICLIIGYIAFFLLANININASLQFILLCVFGIFIFIGQGFFYMTMLVMLTNTIEYDEWKNHERNDAITFSVRPFMVKLASAVQYLVVALTLVVCGLYSITEKVGDIETQIATNQIISEEGVRQIEGLLQQVTSGQILGLTAAMTLLPVILFMINYVLLRKKYIIDEQLYDQMIQEIALRNQKEEQQ